MIIRGPHPLIQSTATLTLGLCAFLFTSATLAAPDPFRVSYRLTSNGSDIAEVVQTLDATGPDRWRFSSQVTPAGMLTSLVSGRIEEITELEHLDGRLRPSSYRFQRRGLARDRDVSVRFDWDRLRAYNEVNGDRWSMAIPDDALDKHSLVLAVSADLNADRLAETYPVADGGRLKTYTHQRAGEERLSTPFGWLDTIKLRRVRPGRQRDTLFWHAPELDFVPVRIERRDRGGRLLRMTLTSYKVDRSAESGGPGK
jgi:hypothetical protein